MEKFVTYIRVSTQRQGVSGLGLAAQRKSCLDYVKSQKGEILQEFKDVASGKRNNREGLLSAIDFCKENGCTLVIAKLDRLSRDIEFTFKVINSGINIYFCDMPNVNTLILGVMASVAQYERELDSKRTKEALAAKKARNQEIGGTNNLWGKNTGSNREQVLNKVRDASANSKREKAKNNVNNVQFWTFINKWINVNGEPKTFQEWAEIAKELNDYDFRTATGLKYDASRAAAMYRKMKSIYK